MWPRRAAGPSTSAIRCGGPARLSLAETARGQRRGAEADAARHDHRLFWIVGDAVLVEVMCAAPSTASASLPVRPRAQVDQHDVASVRPLTMRRPRSISVSARTTAFFATCCWLVLELRGERLPNATALPGNDVHQRPALDAGEHAAVDGLRVASSFISTIRRAARAGLCASSRSRRRRAAPGSGRRRRRSGPA